ncbi:MAG TPA: acyl transferase, partial [Chitinophagales bacterium]|nr:acyl transferase [Chitinophagales bacterium]
MINASKLEEKIKSNNYDFDDLALEIFYFQYKYNKVYREFVDLSNIKIDSIHSIEQIPFLPIQFFKTHQIYCGSEQPKFYFESSGTTQSINSKHYIKDLELYTYIFKNGFQSFYGNIQDYNIIALLPNYLERQNSSLVYMFDHLIKLSNSPHSGFYLSDFEQLNHVLQQTKTDNRKTLLLGVTFALLDFANAYPQDLSHCIIMETGGM